MRRAAQSYIYYSEYVVNYSMGYMVNPRDTKPIIVSIGVYNRLKERKNNGKTFSKTIEELLDYEDIKKKDSKFIKIIKNKFGNDIKEVR